MAGDPRRAPKPAPFPVGTRVRYTGERNSAFAGSAGESHPYLFHGVVVEIVRVKEGRRGTGRQLRDEDGPMVDESTGDQIVDSTRDSYSVWEATDPAGQTHGRIIWPEDAHEWEIVKKPE